MSTETPIDPQPRPARSRSMVVLGALGAIVFLVVGATVGLLLAPGREAAGNEEPNAVDVGFAQDMMVHHRQGVLMSHYAQLNTEDPDDDVGILAYDIDSTQLAQLGIMQGWLQVWDKPEVSRSAAMSWMSGSGGHDHMAAPATAAGTASDPNDQPIMPGMATRAEMDKLKSLRGTESDVFYLQLMIRHHLGGVPMMEYAVAHANTDVVRTLAGHMLNSQTAEVNKMTAMLAELGGEPLPAP